MSLEQAKTFLDRMMNDEEFNNAVIRMEDIETKMAFIERQGYSFTLTELEAASNTENLSFPNNARD